ncbi:hypothetical protein B0J11DRAFT_245334 [Dendryphion nanum]|uniref:Uncharacterized protein n=1 Tax=Dendryphion nanum TaxID=256645 RepID=A0A9P9IRV0_9PLEO|nr:hypothetical protein B0J11DRAFT_245334 [Dendryphion nanum]
MSYALYRVEIQCDSPEWPNRTSTTRSCPCSYTYPSRDMCHILSLFSHLLSLFPILPFIHPFPISLASRIPQEKTETKRANERTISSVLYTDRPPKRRSQNGPLHPPPRLSVPPFLSTPYATPSHPIPSTTLTSLPSHRHLHTPNPLIAPSPHLPHLPALHPARAPRAPPPDLPHGPATAARPPAPTHGIGDSMAAWNALCDV